MNLGAFALLGAFSAGGREIETIEDLNGLAARAPAAALAFAICVFSLMGIPPTAGFLGKVYIFSSAFSVGPAHPMHGPLIALAVLGVLNAAIGGAYYLRLAAAAYVGAETVQRVPSGGQPIRWGLALCTMPLLVLFASPALLSSRAKDATIALQAGVHSTETASSLASGHIEPEPARLSAHK
jgi:NADH-quinone oxidoreductase subunit N